VTESEIAIAALELTRNELDNTIQALEFRQTLGVEPNEDEIIAMSLEKFFRPALEQVSTYVQVLKVMTKLAEEEGE
jgi:hypothetical protein